MVPISDVLAEARRLLDESPQEALSFLDRNRIGRGPLPDAFEILAAQAATAAGQSAAALDRLAALETERPPSATLRRVRANLLMDLARYPEAGEQLHRATAEGLPLTDLPLPAKLALQDHLALHHPGTPEAHAIGRAILAEFGVLDASRNVLYIYTPKVACTVLKATIVMNSPRREAYLASGKTIHEFVGADRDEPAILAALDNPDAFRFAVVRDPATRILSAYLNKFVTTPAGEPAALARAKRHAIRVGQQLAGIPYDPDRGITFEEFVHFLAQANDIELDVHWMPQSRIIGTDISRYRFLGRFENLAETFDVLEQRFHYVTEQESTRHLGGQKGHATKYSAAAKITTGYRALPADLRRLGGVYPMPGDFLSEEIQHTLYVRFRNDRHLLGSSVIAQR